MHAAGAARASGQHRTSWRRWRYSVERMPSGTLGLARPIARSLARPGRLEWRLVRRTTVRRMVFQQDQQVGRWGHVLPPPVSSVADARLWWPRRPLATLDRKPRQGRKAATVSVDAGAEVSRRGHRHFHASHGNSKDLVFTLPSQRQFIRISRSDGRRFVAMERSALRGPSDVLPIPAASPRPLTKGALPQNVHSRIVIPSAGRNLLFQNRYHANLTRLRRCISHPNNAWLYDFPEWGFRPESNEGWRRNGNRRIREISTWIHQEPARHHCPFYSARLRIRLAGRSFRQQHWSSYRAIDLVHGDLSWHRFFRISVADGDASPETLWAFRLQASLSERCGNRSGQRPSEVRRD